MTSSTNSELIRRELKTSQIADALLNDLSTASKLLNAAGRIKDSERARQYFLIATSTYVEIAETVNTLELSPAKQLSDIQLALAELAEKLRDYRPSFSEGATVES